MERSTALPRTGGWRATAPALTDRAWMVLAAGVLALQAWLVLDHQPFFDEWQAVQIAVQAPDLGALIENLRYESHPPLWYLLLRGLAAVVGPYHALAAAALLLGLTTQWIILQASPFPRWTRLSVALAEPILFEFIAVSRGHTLGLALIFLALALWRRDRLVWLPLALLPSVDFFYGLFALALIFWRLSERRLWWPGLAGFALVGMLSAWSIIPAADYVPVYGPSNGSLLHFRLALLNLSVVYLPLQGALDQFAWNTAPPGLMRTLGWALLLMTMALLTRCRWPERVALFGLFGAMLAFSACLYPLQNRHLFLLSVMLVAVQWRKSEAGERTHPAMAVWLGLGAACGLWTAAFALNGQFDRSAEIARHIRERQLDGYHWVAMPDMAGQGVAALTHIPFERMDGECVQDFVRWNSPRDLDIPDFEAWLRDRAAERGRFYVLSTIPLAVPGVAKQIAHFPGSQAGVQHFIYAVGQDEPPMARNLPDCVPGLRPFGTAPRL